MITELSIFGFRMLSMCEARRKVEYEDHSLPKVAKAACLASFPW